MPTISTRPDDDRLSGEWRIKRWNTRGGGGGELMHGAAHFYAAESEDTAALCGVARASSRALLRGEQIQRSHYCDACIITKNDIIERRES